MTEPTFINFHPNENGHELCYCLFVVNLDRFAGICNICDGLYSKLCVPNKTRFKLACF